jgi:UDP-N-acetylmuramate--alanine ligase
MKTVGEILHIDDYGHHPCEIAATLDAINAGWNDRRLVVAFQPHRYSRTHDLFDDFVEVLSKIENLVLLDIYPAGENPIEGVTGESLCDAIAQKTGVKPQLVQQVAQLKSTLTPILKNQDILLTLGAGNIGQYEH